jgi:hypothetical protein
MLLDDFLFVAARTEGVADVQSGVLRLGVLSKVQSQGGVMYCMIEEKLTWSRR